MFKNVKVDLRKFMEVIDTCEGPVYALTKEGDKINMKSKLSQMIGILGLIENGIFKIENLFCEKQEDASKIFRFLIYGEILF